MNVYHTTYDSYYIVVENGKTSAYEGKALCPPRVDKWLKSNKPTELNCFYYEAISYGYCK
jgi:hypothetical protein